ncbi:MAG: hypothetical protein J0H54_07210 [Rhizobiales bacterium]|nr:hypothetical protein [Hyphomicrobiales bacterium]
MVEAKMLRRRFLALSAATVGYPVWSHAATEAKPQIDCSPVREISAWKYIPHGDGYCDFSRAASRVERVKDEYFNLSTTFNQFRIATGDVHSAEVNFTAFKEDLPWKLDDTIIEISVDGQSVWKRGQDETGYWVHYESVRFEGPNDAIIAAMRSGKLLTVAISNPKIGPLASLDFPLEGFSAAYDDWESFRADVARRIADGAECQPEAPLPGCYFTTAACDVAGLDDDCFELAMLRRFRDGTLAATAAGRIEIAQYYAEAPAIVAAIAARDDAGRRFLRLYAFLVLPCAILIRFGFPALAHRLYRRSFLRLARETAAD